MKFLNILILILFLQNCSFDQKSGIWNNENSNTESKKSMFKDFQKLSSTNELFDQIIKIDEKFNFKLPDPVNNLEWSETFFDKTNNIPNLSYKGIEELIFKSKKITSHKISEFILYEDNNLILSDEKGNLIIYSISENKVITKFNFYKKRFRAIKKKLNLIVNSEIIYVSDNLGYIYAFDYNKKSLLWAKNYKIPFRSNLKIIDNKLVASNQNNSLYFLDLINGNQIKLIPTEDTLVKNRFINNISLNDTHSLFLNTYGSLYAIDNTNIKINWFINLNQSMSLNPTNLFEGTPIITEGNKIVISSNKFIYILDNVTGSILHKKNLSVSIKPIIVQNYLFLITNNDLLISMNLETGKIIYSLDINQKIADFLDTKKKKAVYKNFFIANKKIIIFLENSYVLTFSLYGKLEKIKKLPANLNTFPIIVDGSIIYVNKRNKITILN